MAIIYVALGSNEGDREEQVLRAVHEMRSFSRVKKISTLIETLPQDVDGVQDKFFNAVVELETDFDPEEVLDELLAIEEDMGRNMDEKGKALPRGIDLDLIAYEEQVYESDRLQVPHPKMTQRKFVVGPFAELNPQWTHPIEKKKITDILKEFPEDE
ncbi:MAG: 2-amino-4-hydroxy-6-hydroxymethyldihydropteridine diphosphokinase [Bdellovibrionota bacterium]